MKTAPSPVPAARARIGKIAQAQGGTLFLDEIGDMPLALQGRLLRVLQERAVTPLGSQRVIPVEFALVCATNQPCARWRRAMPSAKTCTTASMACR
jgi:transcriptional regulator with PAS, ATPase and Fis domain